MTPSKRVALCVTCLVDQVMPEVGVATVQLLRRAGFTVAFPEGQTCCGQPFFNSGFVPQAAKLAQRTIELFEPYEAVVLPSGSCTTMLRVEYAHLFEDDAAWHARAERLAAKTYELSEFLALHGLGLTQSPIPPKDTVTYHDSCHMCRALGLKDQPRELLSQTGHTVAEMSESDRCCGFGGLFSLRMPEVSNAMTGEKLRQAKASGAQVVVTADPGCLMQMRGLAGDDVRIEHLATVIEAATR